MLRKNVFSGDLKQSLNYVGLKSSTVLYQGAHSCVGWMVGWWTLYHAL